MEHTMEQEMERREVTKTEKDEQKVITALCNPDEEWSPRLTADAISDIEDGRYEYFVGVGDQEVDILVVPRGPGKYLRTSRDETEANNLDELDDC